MRWSSNVPGLAALVCSIGFVAFLGAAAAAPDLGAARGPLVVRDLIALYLALAGAAALGFVLAVRRVKRAKRAGGGEPSPNRPEPDETSRR